MIIVLLFLAVCFIAYANGVNDNFKSVASLFGSRTCGYCATIGWATVTTFAGSVAAIFLAQTLMKTFSGKGLVPDALTALSEFIPGFSTRWALLAGDINVFLEQCGGARF